jgi:hypothetical protein
MIQEKGERLTEAEDSKNDQNNRDGFHNPFESRQKPHGLSTPLSPQK